MKRKGSCLCGHVSFEVEGPPTVTGLCHCSDCRKATGSAFLAYGQWPSARFAVTGDFSTFDGRSFCTRCGSRLFHINEHHVGVNLGSLDDAPFELAPQRESWVKRREPWLVPVPATTQHREDPQN